MALNTVPLSHEREIVSGPRSIISESRSVHTIELRNAQKEDLLVEILATKQIFLFPIPLVSLSQGVHQ